MKAAEKKTRICVLKKIIGRRMENNMLINVSGRWGGEKKTL